MPYNPMSHVGLEADYAVTPEQLVSMSTSWHYAWTWSGPETTDCACHPQPCGLVTIHPSCHYSHGRKVAAARQLHKAADCPQGDQ